MNGRGIARLIGAALCAYLVVLQAALGGLAMAGHGGADDPLSLRCVNSVADDQDGDAGGPDAPLGCCTLGCVSVAATPPYEPVVSVFAYDPRPTPRRTAVGEDAPPPAATETRLKRPRGPPSLG